MAESAEPASGGNTESKINLIGHDFSLKNILGKNPDDVQHPKLNGVSATGWDEESTEKAPTEGYCIECEDQPAYILCETCKDVYCEVCFAAQHRKGTRKQHLLIEN